MCGGIWKTPELRTALKGVLGGGTLENLEIVRVVKGLGERTLIMNARGIARHGRAPVVLLSIDDVTERRQAEALRLDAETLRRVDRRKDEFLGILAHELRNPLAPMRFAVEILRRAGDDNGHTTKARQVLDRQLTHMVRIVDDLLDVSRITQGKVELRREVVDLKNVVSAAVDLCQPTVDAAGQDITVSLPAETVRLDADPVRLAQVLVNLVNNAVKFTPYGGHIWLMAETTGEHPEAPDLVRIRVRDSGIGIAPDLLPRIFDLFMQGDRSLERTRGGLGVGLTLVRSLVLLHGGSVEARSDGPGTGSEFVVTLPLDPDKQPAAPRRDAADATEVRKRRRILIADDNADAREMLSLVLGQEGHTVKAVPDGVGAIAAAAEFNPEVAILDIGMPGLSGYDVAERLRDIAPATLHLVALSGLGQEADRSRAIAAGFNHHFTKPVDPHTLVRFLAALP
jgi:signal transduction histidine kinase